MNPTAIYSKSGKGVQEASGKTSLLKRPDRAVLSAIDGRATLADVAQKVGRPYDASFQVVIQQLDKDGFIREVTAGTQVAAPSRPMAPPSRPAPSSKPAGSVDPASDLDFSSLGAAKAPPSRPAAPPPPPKPPSPQQLQQAKAQQSALDKAREEAEAKAAADRDRVRKEAEEKAKAEIEAKMRVEAEKKMKDEAEARAKADAEAKVKAAREAALRAAAEAKAKADAEAKAKLEAERKAREEIERRLEAERKAKEQAERIRKEAEEKARREAEELRQRLEAERKAREEAERKAKEEAERLRKEAEEHARKVREEAERKAKEEAERMRRELEAERQRLEEERRKEEEERAARRKQRDEEERREEEERAARRRQRDEEEEAQRQHAAARAAQVPKAEAPKAEAPKAAAPRAAAKGGSFADSLLSDLESFTNKDEEEHKARADAEQKARAETEQQRREEAERRAQEEAEARRREEDEARRREDDEEEEKRKAREEELRLAREEERRRREAEEIQRKAEAATAAAMAKQASGAEDDIPISDEDLDMEEVKKERKALGIDEKKEKEREREAKKRKRAEEKKRREAEKKAAKAAAAAPPSGVRARRKANWGRPLALLLAVILIVAIGAAHVVPLETAQYERAATEALGQPVKIGSARLWLFTGVQVRFENVRVGQARIARVIAHPALGSLLDEQKNFNLIEIEGAALPQPAFGEALFSRVKGDRFSVERIKARELQLPGRLALPKLDVEIDLDRRGALRSATLRGPDGLNVHIVPKGELLQYEATAAGFPLPIAQDVTLSKFAMKGTATRHGMDIAEWGGAIFNGGISGTAKVRWGSTWEIDGVVTVRSINAAVFAPALLSEGTAEGTGRFSMSGSEPAKLLAASHMDGRFTIGKGTLGSFDLSRAIQTRGKQFTGTTQFAELNGQVTYDRGTVALRNVTIGAGALNAGASADITKGGALSGRIVADVRTAAQTLSATLLLGGTVKEPQVRD